MLDPIDSYGISRTVAPPGVLPQQAQILDPALPLRSGEISIDVAALQVDATSFRDLCERHATDEALAAEVMSIVRGAGKLHNPRTGSGGMLLGRVAGFHSPQDSRGFVVGDRIATLASLTLTPLSLSQVLAVDRSHARLSVVGHAIVFATAALARIPPDLDEDVALALFDVCGAPAVVPRWVSPEDLVLVLGVGKSGSLIAAAARELGARVIAVDLDRDRIEALEALHCIDRGIVADARDPLSVLRAVLAATQGRLADVVFSCCNIGDTEMSAILATRPRGTCVFYSMATSFSRAALGAEGVSRDIALVIGNGYANEHAGAALQLVRRHPFLASLLLGPGAAVGR